MKKIDWQDLKRILGTVTWVGVSVMVIHHTHQAISQAWLTASRSNQGRVSAAVEPSPQNSWMSFSFRDLFNQQNTRNSQNNDSQFSISSEKNTNNNPQLTTQIIARNCRLINNADASARNVPQGKVVYQFEPQDQVYIENIGKQGWVPIQYPIQGYVDADNLTDC
ncbi:MAG: hypothetical protein WBA77_06840 [Microcoleaceae cyanobacterium]